MPAVPEAVKVALVGYGLGGSVFHAPLIDATPGLSLSAVVTGNPGRRVEVRSKYPRTAVLATLDELLAEAGEWDLVVVTTPNASHFAVAEAVVAAGVTVVIDKPVTPTSAEAQRLADLAAERGVGVIPYHNRRWDGDFLTVSELVGSGRLGRIWRFESRFERWRPDPPAPGSWKYDPNQPGNGILYDLGSHLVDQALRLFGLPSTVYAEQLRRTGDVDDDTFIALRYEAGPVVHLWASSTAAQLGPRFRVLGSEAAYVKYGMDPQEEALRSGQSPGTPGWGEEPPALWGRLGTLEAGGPLPTRPGAYPDFYAGVADHLLHGAPPPVAIEDAVAGLRILEAALRSADSGDVQTP